MLYIHYMNREPNRKLLIPAISPAAPKPLYEQIIDGVKREISAGRLGPNTPLPSFRTLAEDLLVSVITVKRAYEELERAGIIYRKQGLGTFVSENGLARSREVKSERTEQLLREALREGREAGLSSEELQRLVNRLLSGP
jgi:GntR family transcriptional regulator